MSLLEKLLGEGAAAAPGRSAGGGAQASAARPMGAVGAGGAGRATKDDRFDELLARLDRIAAALETLALHVAPGERVAAPDGGNAKDTGSNGADAAAPEPAVVAPPPRADERLLRFLARRGITVKAIPEPSPADATIDSLADYLGDRYQALRPLLAKIKRTMQRGDMFDEHLAGRAQEDIASNCQFCHRLHEIALLTEYNYQRAPKCVIHARPSTLPTAQNFFSGKWLERFVLRRALAFVQSRWPNRDVASLLNPQIALPNGDDFELDVMIRVDDDYYWIEAKTGAYQEYVAKYSRISRLLSLDADHAALVLLDAAKETCDDVSALFGMTVCSLEGFGRTWAAMVERDFLRGATRDEALAAR